MIRIEWLLNYLKFNFNPASFRYVLAGLAPAPFEVRGFGSKKNIMSQLLTKYQLSEIIFNHVSSGQNLPPRVKARFLKRYVKLNEALFQQQLLKAGIHTNILRKNLYQII